MNREFLERVRHRVYENENPDSNMNLYWKYGIFGRRVFSNKDYEWQKKYFRERVKHIRDLINHYDSCLKFGTPFVLSMNDTEFLQQYEYLYEQENEI